MSSPVILPRRGRRKVLLFVGLRLVRVSWWGLMMMRWLVRLIPKDSLLLVVRRVVHRRRVRWRVAPPSNHRSSTCTWTPLRSWHTTLMVRRRTGIETCEAVVVVGNEYPG